MLFWLGLGVLVSCRCGVVLVAWSCYFYLRCEVPARSSSASSRRSRCSSCRAASRSPEAEDVRFPTARRPDAGRLLPASARGRAAASSCSAWNSAPTAGRAVPYCEYLLAAGYDVFAFETRGQGDSDRQPGYEPLQWVTDFEVADAQAALAYLKSRPDADPRGVGFFGISKGGRRRPAGRRPRSLRALLRHRRRLRHLHDAGAVHAAVVPHLQQPATAFRDLCPSWYYGLVGLAGAAARSSASAAAASRTWRRHLPRLAPRPLLMIHGEADTYIKPEMARGPVRPAPASPKELWLVEGAKHNQALHDGRRRVPPPRAGVLRQAPGRHRRFTAEAQRAQRSRRSRIGTPRGRAADPSLRDTLGVLASLR